MNQLLQNPQDLVNFKISCNYQNLACITDTCIQHCTKINECKLSFRRKSSLIECMACERFRSVVVIIFGSEPNDPGSNPGGTLFFLFQKRILLLFNILNASIRISQVKIS